MSYLFFYQHYIFILNKKSNMQVTTEKKREVKSQIIQRKQQQPSQWDILVKSLVRPPRMKYNECQLGYKNFTINDQVFDRSDQIILHGDKRIYLSIFEPTPKNFKLILYLHGNSSSKLQCKSFLPYLPPQYSLAAFDFIGCGNNMEQDIITLGHNQSKQVQTVVNYLRQKHFKVYLWGRSMGAVSALKYGKADVIVADSPFRSMKNLCKELSTTKANPLPNAIVTCLFPCVFMKLRSDILQKGKYDLSQLDTEKAVKQINPLTTLVFLSGNQDQLVHHRNSQKLFDSFLGSSKYFELVPGNHNSTRPPQVIKKIMRIIQQKSQTHQIVGKDIIRNQQIHLKL